MSMKKSNDSIGNQTCDLPACSAVPQPTAPPHAPFTIYACHKCDKFFKDCGELASWGQKFCRRISFVKNGTEGGLHSST